MRKQVEELRDDMGYQPIVVVSKADEGEDPEVRRNPLNLPPAKRESIKQLADELGMAHNNVYHMVSYTDEKERCFGIDKLAYIILHEALKRAKEFIRKEEKGCGDYSSNSLVTRAQRQKQTREDFSQYTEGAEVVNTTSSSTSISTCSNPQYAPVHSTVSPSTTSPSDSFECALCMEGPKADVAFDCGHQCLCVECKDKISAGERCPICRKQIEKVIKLFVSTTL